jgi:hypothetical protein
MDRDSSDMFLAEAIFKLLAEKGVLTGERSWNV